MSAKTVLVILAVGAGVLVLYFLITGYEATEIKLANTSLAIAQANTRTAQASHATTGDVILGGLKDVGAAVAAFF